MPHLKKLFYIVNAHINCLLDYSTESMGIVEWLFLGRREQGCIDHRNHEWKTKVTFCWSPTWWSNEFIEIIYEDLFMGPCMIENEPHCQ